MTDDRQRLRERTVQGAKGRDPWRDNHPGMFTPWVRGVLAMESLLTEAEARVRALEAVRQAAKVVIEEDQPFAFSELEDALDAAEQEEGT